MAEYLMALDQGTTSSRCLLFDRGGRVKASAQTGVESIYPRPAWVEQDPLAIWSSQLAVLTEARARAGCGVRDIAALGITNQRETTLVWERRSGKPVYNAIVWQCRRAADFCQALKAGPPGELIRRKTGLPPDAYFSAAKIRWILDHAPEAQKKAENGDLLFGTVDTWLVWNLTGGRLHLTDSSNASRTMLFNIHELDWDEELLSLFGVPRAMLPEVRPSSQVYGATSPEVTGWEIPIAGIAGDQQAALFGQLCHEPGMAKNTYGTGCFILMHAGKQPLESRNGLLSTIAWNLGGQVEYALEGSIFTAGSAIQWLRDGLRMLDSADLSEAYARRVPDSNGVYLVPAFAGLGAPHWDPYARGTIVGLTAGVRKEHLVRAALESLAYQSHDVIRAMEADAGIRLKSLCADGGASANGFLMQFQADILDAAVSRPGMVESTALGAAYLAGLGAGIYANPGELAENASGRAVFTPSMPEERRRELLAGWREAVKRSLGWAGPGGVGGVQAAEPGGAPA